MKKAQIQMMESVFVMVIFLFLVGFGLIFYFSVSKSSNDLKGIEIEEQRSIEVALFISQLPELQCSEGGTEGGACIDLFKAAAISSILSDTSSPDHSEFMVRYFDMFGFAQVSLRGLYPNQLIPTDFPTSVQFGDDLVSDSTETNRLLIYERVPEDKLRKAGRTIFFPVTLRDIGTDGDDLFLFGELQVVVFT